MIKRFLQFINENHEGRDDHDVRAELADLVSLHSLGMIDDEQYYSDAIRILKSLGAIPSSEAKVSAYYNDSEDKEVYKFAKEWTGPNGEMILELVSNIDRSGYGETKILLDTGIGCKFVYSDTGEWDDASVEISVADQTFTEQDVFNSGVLDDDEDYEYRETYSEVFGFQMETICKLYGTLAIDSIVKRVIPN